MNKTKKLLLLPLLLVMLGAGVALADAFQQSFRPLLATPTARAAQTSADAQTWGTPLNLTRTNGNMWVTCAVDFTGPSSGGTVSMECGLYGPDGTTFLGFASAAPDGVAAVVTFISAASGTNGALLVTVGTGTWNVKGAPYYDLRAVSIGNSGNSIRVTPWSYGSASK